MKNIRSTVIFVSFFILFSLLTIAVSADPSFAFGGDLLVVDRYPNEEERPEMVCVSSGKCFIVYKDTNGLNDNIYIYSSIDGGITWSYFFGYTSTVGSIERPSIAVPEYAEDYVYVAFSSVIGYNSNSIKLLKVDLNNPNIWLVSDIAVPGSDTGIWFKNPSIVTDNHDWAEYYVYVAYDEMRGEWDFGGQANFTMSYNKGAYWTPPQYVGSNWVGSIAYANNKLYLTTYACYYTCSDVYVNISDNYGATWGSSINLTDGQPNEAFLSKVAAIQDSNEVLVVYTYNSGSSLDLSYSYSTDGGNTWNKNNYLATSSFNEEWPSITVDPTLGNFHVAFIRNANHVLYTTAPGTNPTSWSSFKSVNDTPQARFDTPAIAVDWVSWKAGVAWSNGNPISYGISFDRADWPCPSPNYNTDKWHRVWFDYPDGNCLGSGPDEINEEFDTDWLNWFVEYGRSDNIQFSSGRSIYTSGQEYRITVGSDDGVRLWIDGVLKLDKWFDRPYTTDIIDVYLTTGYHNFKLDYYENAGGARVSFAMALQQKILDLIITDIISPKYGAPGDPITIIDTTKNLGPDNALASTTKFYWSNDSTWDAGDTYLGSRSVPDLLGGESDSGITTVTVPAGVCSGKFYIIAKADADNVIYETNENNNNMSKIINTGPDLIVAAIKAPETVKAGQMIFVGDTTKNKGGCPAGPSTTKFYLSINSKWDSSDIEIGYREVQAIPAGTSNKGIISAVIPAGAAPGTYYIIAKADANNAVPELKENNNSGSYKVITITP